MTAIIQINVPCSDIGFLIEAIEMRSNAMIEALLGAMEQSQIEHESRDLPIAENAVDPRMPVFDNPPKKKRAAKKRVSRKTAKTAEALWGYKKDGTPKKRPGRAPKIGG